MSIKKMFQSCFKNTVIASLENTPSSKLKHNKEMQNVKSRKEKVRTGQHDRSHTIQLKRMRDWKEVTNLDTHIRKLLQSFHDVVVDAGLQLGSRESGLQHGLLDDGDHLGELGASGTTVLLVRHEAAHAAGLGRTADLEQAVDRLAGALGLHRQLLDLADVRVLTQADFSRVLDDSGLQLLDVLGRTLGGHLDAGFLEGFLHLGALQELLVRQQAADDIVEGDALGQLGLERCQSLGTLGGLGCGGGRVAHVCTPTSSLIFVNASCAEDAPITFGGREKYSLFL